MASHFFPTTTTRMLSPSTSSRSSALEGVRNSFGPRASLSTNFVSPHISGCVTGEFSGRKILPASLNRHYSFPSASRAKRSVITMVAPGRRRAYEQPPPDLESHFFKNRIVYLGTVLHEGLVEVIIAQMIYLANNDNDKPMYLYLNSTGTTKDDEKFGRETEAFAILDTMRCVGTPVFTLCVGHAWGEAALLLAAGAKGHRSALPSSTIMIREPIDVYQGQASYVEIFRRELQVIKQDLVKIYAECTGKTKEQIETDIRRPKYFSPSEAVEYGLIDKVLETARGREGRGIAEAKMETP